MQRCWGSTGIAESACDFLPRGQKVVTGFATVRPSREVGFVAWAAAITGFLLQGTPLLGGAADPASELSLIHI